MLVLAYNIRHYHTRCHIRHLYSDVKAALGVSLAAVKVALSRLSRQARQELITSPARGFYIIVPPEYRSLGCLPADQFIPDLMRRLERS